MGFVTNNPGQEDDDGDLEISVSLPGELYDPDAEPDGGEAPAGEVEAPAEADADDDGEVIVRADEELVVELDDWSDMARAAAEERLRESGIPHWWVGTSVHGSVSDAAAIDLVLDEIDADEPDPLDPERDQVAYDMDEWDDDRLATLGVRLEEAEIPFTWDGEELFVYAEDEDRVDELIEAVEHPDELPAEEDDGESEEASAALMGELFVAADRLQHDPKDHEQAAAVLLASERVDQDSPPYGLATGDWRHVCERVEHLAEALDQDELDQEAVVTAAKDLRTSLRPYV